MCLDVDFKTKKDRLKFEDYLKSHNYNCRKLTDYHEEGEYQMHYAIYYGGYMGYAEPKEILEKCLKKGIKITYFAWIPISDRDLYWEKLRGRIDRDRSKTVQKCFNECLTGDKPLCKDKYCLVNNIRRKKDGNT